MTERQTDLVPHWNDFLQGIFANQDLYSKQFHLDSTLLDSSQQAVAYVINETKRKGPHRSIEMRSNLGVFFGGVGIHLNKDREVYLMRLNAKVDSIPENEITGIRLFDFDKRKCSGLVCVTKTTGNDWIDFDAFDNSFYNKFRFVPHTGYDFSIPTFHEGDSSLRDRLQQWSREK